MKKYLLFPAFNFGLIIKIILIIFFLPEIQKDLFNDFISFFLNAPSIDAWTNYLKNSGELLSFPYGPVMLTVFLPLTFLLKSIGFIFGNETYFISLGFKLTLLIFDFCALILFEKLFPKKLKHIIYFYWLSPLIFYVTYIHGQVDLIPTVLLLGAYIKISQNQFKLSGYFLGLALASKLSISLIFPIPIIYLLQNKRLTKGVLPFCKAFLLTTLFLVILPLFSYGYQRMVFGTPTLNSIFWLKFNFGNQFEVFLLPITLLLIFYFVWRIKRSNFTLLTSVTGLAFLMASLMMPPNPGWYLWSLPFLIIYQLSTDFNGKLLVSIFSLCAIFFMSINFSGSTSYLPIKTEISFKNLLGNFDQSFLFTILIGIGITLCIRLYRETIKNNDYFLLSRYPISIGICGGPKTGKEFLTKALVDIFGEHSTKTISQKKYLKWPINSPMWKTVSQYDSRSQDLLKLSRDLDLLLSNNSINNQKNNHPKQRIDFRNDAFIIINGCHLYQSKSFSENLSIKIYLEPSPAINYYWYKENYSANNVIKDNLESSIQYYDSSSNNQKNNSDIVFKLSHINEDFSSFDEVKNRPLKLDVYLSDGIYAEKLIKALISICGVKANLDIDENNFEAHISVEGDVWPEDIKLASSKIVPNLEELIDINPKWSSDSIGIMQLIVLMQVSHYFKSRDLSWNGF